MIKKAIILAAGRGTRMGSKGKSIPKCLFKVPGTKITFLERQIRFLKQTGIKKIIIITGHQSLKIKNQIKSINTNIKILYFPHYKHTNNLQTLLYFKEELNESFICLFSDIIYEKVIIKNLLKKRGQVVAAIDTGKVLPGTMRIKLKTNKLKDIGSQIKVSNGDGNFIGICKFNKNGVIKLKNKLILNSNNKNDYYTLAVKNIIEESDVDIIDCKNNFWMEIDDSKDYSNLKKKLQNMKQKLVYVGVATDILNEGHINLLKKAKKLGRVMVGLFTDKAISKYKTLPYLNYKKRYDILASIKYVDTIVEQDDENYIQNLNQYKPDLLIHGDNWKQKNGKVVKLNILKTLKKWNGKLIEIKYLESADKKKEFVDQINKLANNPENKVSKLNRLIKSKKIVRLLECHNALSGHIIDNLQIKKNNFISEFDGMWSSSLADSAVRGKPDNGSVDFSTRISSINEIFENTTKPLLFDADNGGKVEHLRFLTRSLERMGVSGLVMEDKKGSKLNSLFNSKKQSKSKQDSIQSFCKKINTIKEHRKNSDLLIFARVESLILGKGMVDALRRAKAYHKAGADVILIHSKERTPDEIFEFSRKFRKIVNNPILACVPSTYSKTTEAMLVKNNFQVVIYANQLLRTIYPAMIKTAKSILKNERSFEAEKEIENISNIISLFK